MTRGSFWVDFDRKRTRISVTLPNYRALGDVFTEMGRFPGFLGLNGQKTVFFQNINSWTG